MGVWSKPETTSTTTHHHHHHYHHLSLTPPPSPTPTAHATGDVGGSCGGHTHTHAHTHTPPGPSSTLGVSPVHPNPPTPTESRPHAHNGTPSTSPSSNGVNGVRVMRMEEVEEEEREEEVEEEEDLKCGLGSVCSPKWAQVLAAKQVFLIVFSLTSVLQGMFYTYYVSVLTTIERLFQFKSKTTGIIMSATEMGQIGGALLLAYYGGQGHRPKWIGWGMLLFAFCAFLSALPHFLYGTELIRKHFDTTPTTNSLLASSNLCKMRHNDVDENYLSDPLKDIESAVLSPLDCESPERETQVVLSIFFLSLLGIGIGQTAAYNLGIPYIDDNIASQETPIYFAVTSGVRILGPTLGFVLGFVCTRLYVDPLADPGIDPTDPRWIGAWWLGLVVVAVTLSLTSIAMFAFPRRLPPHQRRSQPLRPLHALPLRPQHAPTTSTPIKPWPRPPPLPSSAFAAKDNPSLTDFIRAIWRLLRNRILLLRTASNVLHILPIAGLYTFLPKYLESQFRLPVHTAALVSGIGGILVMGVGIFASGLYIWQAKPTPRTVAAWIALSALVYAIGMVILMFVGCPPEDFAGLVEDSEGKHFEPLCDLTCGECDLTSFAPVCDPEKNKAFFSACHLGCTNATHHYDPEELVFSHCDCLDEGETVILKLCGMKCGNFEWYVVIFSAFVLVHSTSEVGGMLLTLRCVAPQDKAMALGLISVAIGLLSNVPCPIIYGAVVDSACIQWKETCSHSGACQLYDTDAFRRFFHGMTGAVMFLAFFIDLCVWHLADSISFDDAPCPPSPFPTHSSPSPVSHSLVPSPSPSPVPSPSPSTVSPSHPVDHFSPSHIPSSQPHSSSHFPVSSAHSPSHLSHPSPAQAHSSYSHSIHPSPSPAHASTHSQPAHSSSPSPAHSISHPIPSPTISKPITTTTTTAATATAATTTTTTTSSPITVTRHHHPSPVLQEATYSGDGDDGDEMVMIDR